MSKLNGTEPLEDSRASNSNPTLDQQILAARTLENGNLVKSCITDTPCLRLSLCNEKGRTQLTPTMVRSLLEQLKAESEPRLMTIEGVPGSFCTGLDIESLALQYKAITQSPDSDTVLARFAEQLIDSVDVIDQFGELLNLIERMPCPVIALVDGPALGGGVGLAAVADLVLVTSKAKFALPESLMGLIPAMVFPFIAGRIGVPRARIMALGAKPLSASRAFEIGLADELVDDPETALAAHARRFLRMDPRAIGAIKSLLPTHFAMVSTDYNTTASLRFLELLASKQTRERLLRFVAGEPPWPEATVS